MIWINNQRMAQIAGVHFNSEKILPGPVVYSRTHLVQAQFRQLATFGRCNLVTSFSDDSVTDKMAEALPPNVGLWFSNNVMTTNPRVIPFPIGLRYSQQVEDAISRGWQLGRTTRRNLMYVCFDPNTPRAPNPRAGLYEKFAGLNWVTEEGGATHISLDSYVDGVRSHAYVLSPPGAGPDCHRHWESLILGSVPIVLRSRMTDLLNNLPCLKVDSWDEVTQERLERELPAFQAQFQTMVLWKMDVDFWRPRITHNDSVTSCGIPRTGSTLTWQILHLLYPQQYVRKVHPTEWEPTGDWVVTTVRHPLDSAASRYRMRLLRAEQSGVDPTTEYISGWTGMEAELNEQAKHFVALRNMLKYPRLILLKYEDFVHNYDVIFDAIQFSMGRVIPPSERETLTRHVGLEANRRRSEGSRDDQWHIHHGHVATPEPGQWRKVIPEALHERVVEACRPFCKEWGYEAH